MRATRRRGEQRDADSQQEKDAEADREILSACTRHRGLERSALVLHEQPPASQFFVRTGGGSADEWLLTPEARPFRAAGAFTNRRTRRPTEEESLEVHAEQRHRRVRTERIDRRIRIRSIEHIA